ncbi:hypothetical protein [Mucilaginibacter gossypiicola]|nr:hypothetical protein [Mucilaginibacter gossypiicola]
MEPTFENKRFVTMLYYAIDDLFKVVKNSWITYESINETDRTLTIVKHDIFSNKVGTEHSTPVTFTPRADQWEISFAGRSLEELNVDREAMQTTKFQYEFCELSDQGPLTTEEVLDYWLNSKYYNDYYKTAFATVVDKDFARNTFERYIERIETIEKRNDNFSINTEHNGRQAILNFIQMPDFVTEIRKSPREEYVKVFLRDKTRLPEIQIILSNLTSVKNVNITKNKEDDLTVYHSKLYSAEELEKDIKATLSIVFKKNPGDPVIIEDVLKGIGENTYQRILDLIYYFGQNLEHIKNVYSHFDEEAFRSYFLPFLNTMSISHSATGETFHKMGKTDLLIQNLKGETVFIAECKVWGGAGQIHPALDQLFERYLTWRDAKSALIVFNKNNKTFSDVIEKAIEATSTHRLFKSFTGKSRESSASFIFQHPEDEGKEVQLELMLFNCI